MEATVLLVEDESDVLDLLRYHLKRGGFKVLEAKSGDSGLTSIQANRPDVVILDIMLPGLTGLEVCRALKNDLETASIPILMLTARSDVSDRVKGLEIGADDYVTKPFSPKEVVLRVQGLVRRQRAGVKESATLDLDGITIDKSTLQARLDGKKLELTATELKLFLALANNCGKILSRDTLLRDVWGYSANADTRTVDTHIRRLREKLGAHALRVETIRSEGYRFNPRVQF
jgi:DNA-binding response OmpR family regulator